MFGYHQAEMGRFFLFHVLVAGVIISSHRGEAFTPPAPNIMIATSTRRSHRSDHSLRASILEETEQIEIAEPDLLTTSTRSRPGRRDIVNGKKSPNAIETATSATPLSLDRTKSIDMDKIRATRSKERMIKAQKLLEMAQVSPSQRLEMEEERRGANSTSFSARRSRSPPAAARHFNNTQDVYQMRMGSTFDSVDNPVDSKSLLPGGRWAEERDQSVSVDSSSEMEMRNKISAGQVAEPLIRYDPKEAERLLFGQPAKWLVRNVQIALPFGIWVAGVLFDNFTGVEKQNRRNRAKQLNNIIAGLGPAIIKAGQALSSRPDLLPSEYLDELQKLQDDVPTFSNDVAFRIVEEELKRPFGEVFELVEPEPVAAASIGQVYKAKLKNGQTVAIKIQRPNTEDIVALDLYVLRWWAGNFYNNIFSLLGRDINLQSVMDDFGNLLYAEIDYVAEAANARRFSELYAQDVAVADVFVPKVYAELTTRKVLTMEWVDGFRLTDSEALTAYNLDRKKLVDTLVQCSLRQIMENGFFHADPHAGNLLATKDGRLCYLDFGMMSYAAAKQRNGFLLAVVHIVNRDWGELVNVYQRLGFIPEDTDLKPIELALEDALPDVLNADISELNFKNVVGELGDMMYTYPFSLPPFYISIIRCLGVLEGLAIQVDPKARIISQAYPYIANRVLTDDTQEELREALRRLIFTSDGHIRWSRLESLLDEAKESSGFDVALALDKLVDYVISSDGEELLNDIADQLVEEADSLGHDTLIYVTKALGALVAGNDRSAAKALQSLLSILQGGNEKDEGNSDDASSNLESGISNVLESIRPKTPAMQRAWKIGLLLGTRGASSLSSANSNTATEAANTITKFVPLIRRLSKEPRVTSKANEVIARLGERMVSRGLRSVFGLPEPVFDETNNSAKTSTTVTLAP
ncbi:hypothetical protein ACHAXN_009361 [Cyclotella atomus]